MSLIIWNLPRKKEKPGFDDPDYVTPHSFMNIMPENGVKMTQKITQFCFFKKEIWYRSDKSYYLVADYDAVLWLICYVYTFVICTYLTRVYQCLKYFCRKIVCGLTTTIFLLMRKYCWHFFGHEKFNHTTWLLVLYKVTFLS